ncbi:hypothetical protein BJ742DRAFT_741278 [Cladochytrium replicatum]|nr:hypothetical protein BJ742DRAFT_741278 [Cladochytrium replicatum]
MGMSMSEKLAVIGLQLFPPHNVLTGGKEQILYKLVRPRELVLVYLAPTRDSSVIVDEAAQLTYCNARIGTTKATKRIVLVGDDKQLQPVVQEEARKFDLQRSMFKLFKNSRRYLERKFHASCSTSSIERPSLAHSTPSEQLYNNAPVLPAVRKPPKAAPWNSTHHLVFVPVQGVETLVGTSFKKPSRGIQDRRASDTTRTNCRMHFEIVERGGNRGAVVGAVGSENRVFSGTQRLTRNSTDSIGCKKVVSETTRGNRLTKVHV